MTQKTKYRKAIEEERCNFIERLCTAPESENSLGLFSCSILCGKQREFSCYGEYPNCILHYQKDN